MKPCLTVFVAAGVLVGWFFAPAVSGTSSFAFRDAAHYYHPLFEYVRAEWHDGRPPLWNPYENIGVPLAAQNTPSLFYPGKLLFALPGDFTRLYNAYVVLHVVLAAAGGFALARRLGATPPAATLAAVAYAFSGSVLFQYANVVFLVGASWLPPAMLFADRMLRRRSLAAAAGFGATLAMMILGGDPQMAYNAALLAALLALLAWRDERRQASSAGSHSPANDFPRRRPVLLAIALAVAGLLAAVQILPTLEAAPRSSRALYRAPRNLYELAASLAGGHPADEPLAWYDGLLGRAGGSHEVYQFSVAPWRAVELLWPNVTGRAFPTNGRWLAALGAESDVWDLWTPTLYMGLLPFVLAVSAWSVRRRAPLEVRFFSWMALFGALASLGVYGLGWAAAPLSAVGQGGRIGPEVGGVYWLLTVLLPTYVYFRYPAKLFVLAGLALSMLAARGWDDAWQQDNRRLRRWLLALVALSVLGLAAAALGWNTIHAHGHDAPSVPILGPFDWAAARRDVLAALAQTAALGLVFWFALWLGQRRPAIKPALRIAALLFTVLDLAAAQRSLVLYAPAGLWRGRPAVLDRFPDAAAGARVFRQRGVLPPSWQRSFSEERFTELVGWSRATLSPKYPLPHRAALLAVSETIDSADYRALLDVARRHDAPAGNGPLPAASILDLLSAHLAIVAPDAGLSLESAEPVAEGMVAGVRPSALPRAWIVHQLEVRGKFAGRSPAALRNFTQEVLFPGGRPRDWRRTAVVETDAALDFETPRGDIAAESCRVDRADPLRVEVHARLAAPGLVVLADLDDPGWELTVESDDGPRRPWPILRTNRVMRGALLPPGSHLLVYRYRPRSVMYGAAASGLAGLLLGAAAVYAALRRRRAAAGGWQENLAAPAKSGN